MTLTVTCSSLGPGSADVTWAVYLSQGIKANHCSIIIFKGYIIKTLKKVVKSEEVFLCCFNYFPFENGVKAVKTRQN